MNAIAVHGFVDDLERSRDLAQALGVPFGLVDLHVFPDRELLPTVPPTVPRTVVLYRSLHHPNDRLLATLLAADAYRRAGVERLVLAAPYLCYLRQDAVFAPGQPVSRDVVCRLLGQAFDAVVTVQAHLHRTADLSAAFGRPAENLSIAADLALAIGGGSDSVIVGPDAESAPLVAAAASAVGGLGVTFNKIRRGDREVELTLYDPLLVKGRKAILIDDVCSSGGTLEAAIRRLVEVGATQVDVGVAHALFDARTEARLRAAGASRILSSDSIPHVTNGLSLASRLARTLKEKGLA